MSSAVNYLNISLLTLAISLSGAQIANAQIGGSSVEPIVIEDMEWVDKSRLEKEIISISEFAKSKMGAVFYGDLRDLDTIQQLIDRGFVKNDDAETQAALGLIMARVFLADFPLTLEWKIYRDHLGRSRALCSKGTRECIFPITLLIRRMQVGTHPNVKKIYYETVESMAKFLPSIPYSGGVLHRLTPVTQPESPSTN
jgi:hypothetical protein